ncbi:MAG: TIR domain-containing protein, partial [Candidatus Pacearchaeota archaeon]|nr:TIR domain-containing protein [Candidatus Pacearchaeota archaeon]
MKAFLSHSSQDKEFVQEVADQLGRADCVFDKYSFSAGIEFEKSIIEHLGNTSIFVFFATPYSIESLWCNYEMEEAFYSKINKTISRTIVFIIGNGVGLDKIPNWLKRALIRTESSPSIIAREIQHHIINAAENYQHPLFLGRAREREILEDIVTPYDGRKKPKNFVVFGLPGIGRRSLIASCINELFSLQRIVEIELEAGDNANSLCIKLADKIEPYSCQSELRDIIVEIESLSETCALDRASRNIEKLVLCGELPVFIDSGGCLNDNGTFKTYINKLLVESDKYKDAYFVFVLARRINKENEQSIECLPIDQLSNKSISQLLSKLSDKYEFKINQSQISDLTDYINGYPPSANYVAKQASIYGVPALISDKRQLVMFSKRRFVSHIKDQNLTEGDESVLRILSSFSPLPLEALLSLYGTAVDRNSAHDRIYELIDCSLIRVTEGQNYRISDPIKGSVRDVLGSCKNVELERVVMPLRSHIEKVDDETKLDFSRVLFRINFNLGDETDANIGIRLRSDFIKLLEQAYHQQRYKDAVKLGYEAVKECPEDSSARNFLIKALIQEEAWDEAGRYIDDLYPTDEYRNVYFLRGFLERKRGNIHKAINAYNSAKSHGRGGVGLHRELAHCHIMNNEFDLARNHIEKALSIQPDNSHLIDMGAKLEIKCGDEEASEKYINQLELIDDPKHFNMRVSTFHLKFGRASKALEHAKISVKYGGKRFLSGRVQLIKSLIANSKYDLAKKELSELDNDFRSKKNDVKISLKCTLAVAENDSNVGLQLVEKFTSSSTKQAKIFEKKFLMSLSSDVSIPYEKRKEYTSQLNLLETVDEFD